MASFLTRAASRLLAASLGLAVVALPTGAAEAADSRLVHCGAETCLLLSGHRAHPAVAVRVAGRELAVTGGRAWRATVPLSTARDWPVASGGTLLLTLADERSGTETTDAVAVPPGALGRRVELASLIVSAH